jgi:hypothetical protein
VNLALGFPKVGVLVRLKNSARNCARKRSVMGMDFRTEKSTGKSPPVRQIGKLRGVLPKVKAGMAWKPAAFSQTSTVGLSTPAGAVTPIALRHGALRMEFYCQPSKRDFVRRRPSLANAPARELHRTQAAIHKQLMRLESSLGTRLYEKAGRGILLLGAMEALLSSAESVVAQVAASKRAV